YGSLDGAPGYPRRRHAARLYQSCATHGARGSGRWRATCRLGGELHRCGIDFVPENLAAIDQRLGAPCLALIPFNKANKSDAWQAAGDAMLAGLLPDWS